MTNLQEINPSLFKAIKNPEQMAKALVEITAVVDVVGTPLIHNCYNCESTEVMVFVVGDIVNEMKNLYVLGANDYSEYNELHKACTNVAINIMAKQVQTVVNNANQELTEVRSAVKMAENELPAFECS